ncbi:Hemicentin-1 [Orchesella cincta]|uniref:Hemicentin-1 n=1 Tax=Orchesella cincta TaxID=48709 RepID=A0A1D2N8I8_ORCCI|nr:Hemicentin-1 [Orchesella cincta]
MTFSTEVRESQELSGLSWSAYTTVITTAAAATTTAPVITPETPDANGIPQFHSPQAKITVKKGDRILLPCKIHNLGDNHVIWRHGTNVLAGTNVSTFADERIQLLPDLTLEITGIGYFISSILTGAFQRAGLTHSVTVHDAPTVSLITPNSMSVFEGENVEIGCIPHGNPLPRITWSMQDALIPIPTNMLNLHRITLEKVSRRHAGLYVCHADNGVGRPAIGAVYVRVLYTPEIEIPKIRVHGGVGYKAHLVCLVHSDPPAEVKWRIGQKVVELSDRIYTETVRRNEHNLVLSPVKDYDFQTYTCEANNSRGYDIRHIEFTAVPNPPIIRRWETQILLKGTTGDGKAEGTQIKEEISVTLFWAVECYSSLIDYRLHFRPDKKNEINSFNEDRTPPWKEMTIPADQSTASFLHTKTYTLRGLEPSTIYEAAIKARNRYGWSPISDVCYFSTFPNSSSIKQQEFQESLKKWREKAYPGKEDLELPTREEIAEYISSPAGSDGSAYVIRIERAFGLSILLLLGCIVRNYLIVD